MSKTIFVTRHSGAVQWAAENGFEGATSVAHLNVADIAAGDVVAGTLPVHLAAQVCAAGAEYWHLTLELPAHLRGVELTAAQMVEAGAHVERYTVCSGAVPENTPERGETSEYPRTELIERIVRHADTGSGIELTAEDTDLLRFILERGVARDLAWLDDTQLREASEEPR